MKALLEWGIVRFAEPKLGYTIEVKNKKLKKLPAC